MSPAIQQAFDAFFNTRYLANDVARRHAYEAFEAGWNAAIAQLDRVPTLVGDAGSNPAGSTNQRQGLGDLLNGYDANEADSIIPWDKIIPAKLFIKADDIYAAYPRKVGKQRAIKAIQKAGKDVGMDKLLKAVKAYAEATSRWPEADKQYIPFPATWFNRGSYEDDPKEWERGTAPSSQFSVSH